MNIKTACITSLLASGFVLGSSQFLPAHAYGVTSTKAITLNAGDIGRTLDPITWLVPAGTGTLTQDLSGQALITVSDLTANQLVLSFNITNTTTTAFKSAITGFGLGIDQAVKTVFITPSSNIFDSSTVLTGKQTFPGGFKDIDVCTFTSNNCQGGNINQGLQSGQSDSFTLTIGNNNSGSFASGVTIASYPAKFQSANGSYEVAGVPEPITIVGSGLALGFGALLKKESHKKRSKNTVKA